MLTMRLDAPARVRLVLEDGTTREFVAVEVAVAGVVKARRPPAAAAKPPSEAAPARTYEPRKAPVKGDDARFMLEGGYDSEKEGPELLGDVVAVLNWMRRQLFKLDAATVTKVEVTALRQAVEDGARPSTLCRALVNASRDDFWRRRGDVRIGALVANLGSLSARSRPPSANVDWRERLRALLPQIEKADPFDGADLASRVVDMAPEACREAVEHWTKKLEAARVAG